MFIGQYEHNLEEKGRISIPKKFRSEFQDGGVLTKGLDGCLFFFPKRNWEEFVAKLEQIPLTKSDARSFNRFLTFGAAEVDLDGQGRILLPDYLKNFSKIKKNVIIAGALGRVEIWDREEFLIYEKKIETEGNEIAERLNELGII